MRYCKIAFSNVCFQIPLKELKKPMISKVFCAILKFYQWVSPYKGRCCRFYPSCSTYALWLLPHESPSKALFKILMRIFSCHPYHRGGIDYPMGTRPLTPIFSPPIVPLYYLIPISPTSFIPYYILKVHSERQ
ncbi:membrane protein insertion efficiency factor YidD [Helicobacter cynogastricus]|uniref:membrane protein insertion efficiency factor YidD n=1 Tax=Helicobacter cynogastricus TaxID=329937 RepID=UPI002D778683|nr:membrane protein insertion efficiency factor YidD [Helicobacter cynogastricus]